MIEQPGAMGSAPQRRGGGGLDAVEVERSRLTHGSNELAEIRGASLWQLWLRALSDRTLKILVLAAVVVLAVDIVRGGGLVEGLAILAAVAAASMVSAWNDWRAQAEFKSLQVEKEARAVRVRREGSVQLISSFALVVGDLVEIEVGDKIAADGVLLDSLELEVDQSLLTGESEPAHRPVDSTVLAGTVVTRGRGTMRVTAVGQRTEYGRLRSQLDLPQELTPLQQRLGRLADRMGLFGLGAAVLIFLALLSAQAVSGGLSLDMGGLRQVLAHAVLAVTIVVVAVPEGLPLAVTISLAYSVMKMARDRCLVRRLLACETMGAAEVICADKTGTLTRNRMTVERARFFDVSVVGDPPPAATDLPLWAKELFVEIASVNSTAHLERSQEGLRYIGSPTEGALLTLLESWDVSYERQREIARVTTVLPFTAERKLMSTLVERNGGQRLLSKGAAEIVLERCSTMLGKDGPLPLPPDRRQQLARLLDDWSGEALRPIALAYRDLSTPQDGEDLEHELTLVALLGIGDPLRDEVVQAVRDCKGAGIEVKIVTGDARLTAETVAQRIGALGPEDVVLSGRELQSLPDDALAALLPKLRVIARAIPSDKLRLVEALKRQGKVVAVTGDGTNDAPALKHADVGLAMGRSGTDVAREASDIVLVDDNFTSVVRAVQWGRTIFTNIRSFLQFQLTVSLVALATAFIAAICGQGAPLGVIQLLWVNLIMDTLAALALSLEEPTPGMTVGKPHGRAEPVISGAMWASIASIGALMLIVLLVTLFTDTFVARTDPARFTFVFNLFVLMQVANMVNARATRFDRRVTEGLRQARLFWIVMGLILVVQVLVVQLGGSFFKTVPLGAGQWLACILIAALVIPAGALLRYIGRSLPARSTRRLGQRLEQVEPMARQAWRLLKAPIGNGTQALLLPAGALVAVIGLALRAAGARWTAWGYALFAAGVAAVACHAWERARRRPWRELGQKRSIRLHVALSALLALTLVAQCNYISSRHYSRIDLTATRKFTLSTQTIAILGRLDNAVRFTTVLRDGALSREVSGLLAEYRASGRHVELEQIDPDRDPGEVERLADRLGLKAPATAAVVVEYRGRHRVLPWQDLIARRYSYRGGKRYQVRGARPEFRGEAALTSAIVALTHDEPVRLCFLTGHGERDPDDFGGEGLALARDRLRREGYQTSVVRQITGKDSLAACAIVVQAGPRTRFGPAERGALGAHLARGGKWLVTLEPWQDAGLAPLLKEWGLAARPVYLADPGSQVAGLGASTLVAYRYQEHPITGGLLRQPLVFPYATSVHTVASSKALESANLVLTSDKGLAYTERRGGRPTRGAYAVAAAINEPQNLYAADGRREPARIVAIGDTDFATNAHLHRAANGDFWANAVDWLARREGLIGLRARPVEQRRINLTTGAQRTISWVVLGVVPGLVGLLGAIVAWRRRR